jgi:hypothetical protein
MEKFWSLNWATKILNHQLTIMLEMVILNVNDIYLLGGYGEKINYI